MTGAYIIVVLTLEVLEENPETSTRKVTADQIAELDAVGFDWNPRAYCRRADVEGPTAKLYL